MTSFQKFCAIFILVVGIILIAGIGVKIGQHFGYKKGYADALASIKPDTVYVKDTSHYDKPEPVEVNADGYIQVKVGTISALKKQIASLESTLNQPNIPDTVKVYLEDTTEVQVSLPIEHKTYRDSTYACQISGIQPTLDWIETYNKTAYITVPVPTYQYPKLVVSPAIDAVVLPKSFFIGAGAELDYYLDRWEFSGGGGYGIEIFQGQSVKGPYGKISVKYNLIRK